MGRFASLLVFLLLLGWGAPAQAGDRPAAERFKKQGDVAMKSGKPELALSAYDRAMSADDSYLPAYDAATPLWIDAQRWSDMVARLEVAVKREPGYALGWYHLAFASRRRGDHPRAVAAYQRYLELKPGDVDPYYGLGMSYKAMGERARARAAFETYVSKEKRPERKEYVAKALVAISELDRTPGPKGEPVRGVARRITPFADATVAQKAEARRWVDMGDAARSAKKTGEAIKAYRAAIAVLPGYTGAYFRLGVALSQKGDLRGAIVAWEGALLADPSHEEARRQIEAARAQLARERRPADPLAVITRARKLVEQGRWQSALPVLDELLGDPRQARHPGALAVRAEAHLLGGHADQAITDWLVVLAAAPDDPSVYLGLARAYELRGEPQRAAWFRAQAEARQR